MYIHNVLVSKGLFINLASSPTGIFAVLLILHLQQFYDCNLEALSFVPFIFASTFGISPFQALTKQLWCYLPISPTTVFPSNRFSLRTRLTSEWSLEQWQRQASTVIPVQSHPISLPALQCESESYWRWKSFASNKRTTFKTTWPCSVMVMGNCPRKSDRSWQVRHGLKGY